ncbi:unnamed protein product [Strongylus vulgaris]|uniref:Acyl carrier protein n=1 Tax=Strongylus vulgaris TaxID=40348 RepID=A0A3P7JTL6_STRVU|nr:unnamed protein product [Strongylus vulgaris]
MLQVEERVLKAIRAWDRFPADKETMLKLEADFSKDLGFDSLDQVEIMMAVEDEFGFEIPLEDSEKLKTPRDVFKYICEREDTILIEFSNLSEHRILKVVINHLSRKTSVREFCASWAQKLSQSLVITSLCTI